MIAIQLRGDDAFQAMIACDTAEIALLAVPASRHTLNQSEIDHALIMLRKLRSDLLRARAEFIQQILTEGKTQ